MPNNDKFITLDDLRVYKEESDILLEKKQNNLVSGQNIKTINGTSLLGSGNIAIEIESITDGEIALIFADIDPTAVDPILANNSWDVIKSVCEAGGAADCWSIGDTKTDIGTDGKTRTFRIADMQGLYGKHVVFEQVELEDTSYVFSQNGIGNNYSRAQMRSVFLPEILAKYSLELQAAITTTRYKVATNGSDGTLLELEDKLFLPAEREIFSSITNSRSEEFNALTRFQIYAAGTSAKKYAYGAQASYWWLRSPNINMNDYACCVDTYGFASNKRVTNTSGVAPLFCF